MVGGVHLKRACAFGVMALASQLFAVTPADYAKKMSITVNAERFGSATSVSDMPVPIRLSESIADFSYSDISATGENKDILFTDVKGNILPHEIESWNSAGESIVWVKMPTFNANEKIFMYYGGEAVEQQGSEVWGDYVGVWHMAESAGTVADATGHGLDATPQGEDTSESVATEGPLGNARVNATTTKANYLSVDYDEQLNLGDKQTFSGWVKIYGTRSEGRMTLVTRKTILWGEGWNVSILPGSSTGIGYWGQYNNDWGCLAALDVPDFKENWVHVAVTWNGNTGYMYINGQKWQTVRQSDWTANTWLQPATTNENPMSFGYTSKGNWDDGWSRPLQGAYDEYRLSGAVYDDARIAAEYATQAYSDMFSYAVETSLSGQAEFSSQLTDAAVVSAEGANTFSVSAEVVSLTGSSADIMLLLAAREQKVSESEMTWVVADRKTVTAAGVVSFSYDKVLLGTKLYFRVVNVVSKDATTAVTNGTSLGTLIVNDPSSFEWKANAKGLWSDSANWNCTATDGLPRVGYPTWGSDFHIFGDQTDVLEVDAAYEGLAKGDRGTTLGYGGADITFKGVVDGAAIGYPEGSGFKDGQYKNAKVTLDGVSLTCGSYHVWENASLTLTNSASLYVRWEFAAEGDNAVVEVAGNSELYQDGVDGDRFGFAGAGAKIVLDNGKIRAKTFKLGGSDSSVTTYVGKTPAGIFISGTNSELRIVNYAKIYTEMGAALPIVFTLPEEGFATPPIVKGGTTNRGLFERASDTLSGVEISIAADSPFNKLRFGRLEQQLVDWTYDGTDYPITTSAITTVEPERAREGFYYMPAESDTKSSLWVGVEKKLGFGVVIR